MKAIESDSGIFMLLFCSIFDDISDVKFPIIDLELDCRGRIFFHDISAGEKQCFIEIGEIKSSTEKNIIEKAKHQLILRLKAISKAVMILEGMGEESISSVGRVFVPSSALHRNKINTMTTLLPMSPHLLTVALYALNISQLDDDFMFCKILAIFYFQLYQVNAINIE